MRSRRRVIASVAACCWACGPWATIPRLGCALRSARIAAVPQSSSLVAVVSAAEVDDRDVEVADRGQQLERAAAVLRLLDLVAVGKRFAHPQPHGGVRVDYQAASVLVHSL